MTTNKALFDFDADGLDAGAIVALGDEVLITLRNPLVQNWVVQVYHPDGFNYGTPLLDIAPRASKGAPLLTLQGDTNGQSVTKTPFNTAVKVTMPASGTNSWIVRSIVNGGMSGIPPRPDPTLVHERIIATSDGVSGLRKPVITERIEFEPDAWAGIICDLIESVNAGGASYGIVSNVTSGLVPATGGTGKILVSTPTSVSWLTGGITNAYVSATAAIAGTKIDPDFGAQNITTTGSLLLGAAPRASTGTIRAASGSSMYVRNATNTGDIEVISHDPINGRIQINQLGAVVGQVLINAGSAGGIVGLAVNGSAVVNVRSDSIRSYQPLWFKLGATSQVTAEVTVAPASTYTAQDVSLIGGSISGVATATTQTAGNGILKGGSSTGTTGTRIGGDAIMQAGAGDTTNGKNRFLSAAGTELGSLSRAAGDYFAFGAGPSTAGTLRLSYGSTIYGRNSAGTGEFALLDFGGGGTDSLSLFNTTTSGNLYLNSSTRVQLSASSTYLIVQAGLLLSNSAVLQFTQGATISPQPLSNAVATGTLATLIGAGQSQSGITSGTATAGDWVGKGGSLTGTGTSLTGGNAWLQGGTAATTNGWAGIKDATGSNILMRLNATTNDYLALGSAPATQGYLRLGNSVNGIWSRNLANTGDLFVYGSGAADNQAFGSTSSGRTTFQGGSQIAHNIGGADKLTINSNAVDMQGPFLGLGGAFAAVYSKTPSATTAGTGLLVSFRGQDMVGTGATVGGDVELASGAGATNGRAYIKIATTNVGSFGRTSADFLAFGAVPASAGTERWSHLSTIKGRNNANSADVSLLDWGNAANDRLTIGTSGITTQIIGFATIGDGTANLSYNGSTSGTGHDFQLNGSTVVSFSATSVRLGTDQIVLNYGLQDVKIFHTNNVTTTNYKLTIQAQAAGSNGNYTAGQLDLAAGDANVSLTGTVTGGSTLVRGGTGNTSAVDGNVAIGARPASWQSMAKGIFIANVSTSPAGSPAGGGFLYVSAGALRYRGSAGTDAQIAAA